jgi:hypothetical protein
MRVVSKRSALFTFDHTFRLNRAEDYRNDTNVSNCEAIFRMRDLQACKSISRRFAPLPRG